MATLQTLLVKVGIDPREIRPGMRDVERDVKRYASRIDGDVPVDVDDSRIRSGLREVERDIERKVKAIDGDVPVSVDESHIRSDMREIERDIERYARRIDADVPVDVDRRGLRGSMVGVGRSMGGWIIGGLAAVGIGSAVSSFMRDAFDEAQEALKIGEQTSAVIKSTGGAANVSRKHVEDLAEKLSNLAGVDDELVQHGSNVLLTFKNIRNEVGKGNKMFDQATGVALDMSVALGQDMKSSAILVGKALNDPIKGVSALTRVGVSFTEKQKERIAKLVEEGKTLEAQKMIMRELKSEFAGSAKAQATAADKASVAWANFKEDIGLRLMPVLTRMLNWFTNEAVPELGRFADWFQSSALPKIKAFAAVTMRLMGRLVAWLKQNWPEIRAIITGVLEAIRAYWDRWGDRIVRIASIIWQYISNSVRNGLKIIRGIIDVVTGLIQGDWSRVWQGIRRIISGVWAQIKNLVKTSVKLIGEVIRNGWDALKAVTKKLWGVIRGAVGSALDWIKSKTVSGFNAVVSFIGKIPGRIGSALSALPGAVGGAFEAAGKRAWGFVTGGPLGKAVGYLRDLPGKIKGYFTGLWGDVAESLKDAINHALNLPLRFPGWDWPGPGGIGPKTLIPALAKGGLVKKPTLAMVGEAGPELVVPLHKMKDLIMGGKANGVVMGGGVDVSGFKSGAAELDRVWRQRIEPVFRKWDGAIKRLSKATSKAFRRDVPGAIKHLSRGMDRDSKKSSGSLERVGSFAVRRFAPAMKRVLRRDIPASSKALSRAVGGDSGKAVKHLKALGGFARDRVSPAFKAGAKAVGKSWGAVKNATKGPVKYVIQSVFNRGLIGSFNKIAKFAGAKRLSPIGLPPGFAEGGHTGPGPKDKPAGIVHADEFVIRKEARRRIERTNPGFLDYLNRTGALPGHKRGGFVNPDKRVYVDGEPVSAVHAAQLLLAGRLMGARQRVMQGSWQPPTSYSGTSHTGPGVADTAPGSFRAQWAQRRVGIAAWARNIPGAASAGAGAHIHGISLLSPGARSHPQVAAYLSGGDGLGGRDYGPRPSVMPGLADKLSQFGQLVFAGGGLTLMALPKWARKIVRNPKRWARKLLTGSRLDGPYGKLLQKTLYRLVDPAASWAMEMLGSGGSVGKSAAAAMQYAKRALPRYGWSVRAQWEPLRKLWMKESGWKWNARNPTSGAYGIPQALPPSKMAAAGPDWRTNPATQIEWGLGYIRSRYGSPAAAWAHSQAFNWYGNGLQGGVFKRPTLIGVGERGPERVDVTPLRGRGGLGDGGGVVVRLDGPMTLSVDGQQMTGWVRGIARQEVEDEFAYQMG